MYFQKILLLLISVTQLRADEQGAHFLQDTINNLKSKSEGYNNRRNIQVVNTTNPIKRIYTHNREEGVPALQLTKAELAAIYESAVAKGESIKLDPGDNSPHPITAAIHEINEIQHEDPYKKGAEKDGSGYYYYYYPLKSFMDELSSSGYKQENFKLEEHNHHHNFHDHHKEVSKSHVHSHTHQHNVHIEPPKKNMMDMDNKKKGLEPLFMAISGFIGMTIMFILSILVLPKFDKLKPKGFKDDNDMTSIAKIALQAIEGSDCTERFTCEMGKAARAFNLYDNRFVKLVRRMAPVSVSKRIDKIGKFMDKKYKCGAIQCKRKDEIKTKKIKKN